MIRCMQLGNQTDVRTARLSRAASKSRPRASLSVARAERSSDHASAGEGGRGAASRPAGGRLRAGGRQGRNNPLEPLLFRLAREFSDDQDLSDRLQKLYQASSRVGRKRAREPSDPIQARQPHDINGVGGTTGRMPL